MKYSNTATASTMETNHDTILPQLQASRKVFLDVANPGQQQLIQYVLGCSNSSPAFQPPSRGYPCLLPASALASGGGICSRRSRPLRIARYRTRIKGSPNWVGSKFSWNGPCCCLGAFTFASFIPERYLSFFFVTHKNPLLV